MQVVESKPRIEIETMTPQSFSEKMAGKDYYCISYDITPEEANKLHQAIINEQPNIAESKTHYIQKEQRSWLNKLTCGMADMGDPYQRTTHAWASNHLINSADDQQRVGKILRESPDDIYDGQGYLLQRGIASRE